MTHAKTLRTAIDALRPIIAKGKAEDAVAGTWNEALTLAVFHGQKPELAYATEEVGFSGYLKARLPRERGWTSIRPEGDQRLGGIVRSEGSREFRRITIWYYKWDTTYSDVGGENAKGLAEMMFESDRYVMAKIESRSSRVVMTKFNKDFTKAAYYEVIGEDRKLGPVRRRSYYVKGKRTTYCFDIIEHRSAEEGDSPFTAWQLQGEDPETQFVVESFQDVVEEKPGKGR